MPNLPEIYRRKKPFRCYRNQVAEQNCTENTCNSLEENEHETELLNTICSVMSEGYDASSSKQNQTVLEAIDES